MTRHEPPVPPASPPPGPERTDDIEIDLADDDDRGRAEAGDTVPDGAEYLGSYDSIAGYLRAMLEPEVTPACAWLLDFLDYQAVQRRWEGDGGRLVLERGHVYLVRIRSPEIVDSR